MIQKFIELGEGYSDLYELLETTRANKHRVTKLLALHTKLNDKEAASFLVIMKPTNPGDFQAVYLCREGISTPAASKRYALFQELAQELQQQIISFEVKPSYTFNELQLYYQYLTGILRLNHILPPMR
ncbi:methylthioribose kinase [Bacillus lacus]|uniref:Methylthioribose kinase n=1 Tax=Metabacillus lacus TaxID=1983721 RepID=A0A7X2IW91_9BACI|nr:methylthioribose kinase [Metabacillus lacus]MRX70890.1 methylthioribose kinase [Metabacillus lacus]